MANSTMTQVEIVIGREVRLAERTLINLHFEVVDQIGNLFQRNFTRKMLLLQVYNSIHICVYYF